MNPFGNRAVNFLNSTAVEALVYDGAIVEAAQSVIGVLARPAAVICRANGGWRMPPTSLVLRPPRVNDGGVG